jgi:exodeoxyribonuclease VII large subunit
LHSHAQRLDELEARLRRAMATQIARCQARLAQRHSALLRLHPGQRLQTLEFQRQQLRGRLLNRMQQQLAQHRQTCTLLVEKLHGISPLATLSRGYAIAKNSRSGKILRKADEIQPGEVLETWLAEGRIHSRVESTESLPLPAPSLKNS